MVMLKEESRQNVGDIEVLTKELGWSHEIQEKSREAVSQESWPSSSAIRGISVGPPCRGLSSTGKVA